MHLDVVLFNSAPSWRLANLGTHFETRPSPRGQLMRAYLFPFCFTFSWRCLGLFGFFLCFEQPVGTIGVEVWMATPLCATNEVGIASFLAVQRFPLAARAEYLP